MSELRLYTLPGRLAGSAPVGSGKPRKLLAETRRTLIAQICRHHVLVIWVRLKEERFRSEAPENNWSLDTLRMDARLVHRYFSSR